MKLKKTTYKLTALLIITIMPAMLSFARQHQEVIKQFSGKKAIQLNTFGGDCSVSAVSGTEIKIRFIHTYSNTKFQPVFEEEGETLILKEKFHISDSGNSRWIITVPAGTAFRFTSISGDFIVKGLRSNINASTVSGDVVAEDCEGDLDLKSTSGDLDIATLKGNISVRGVSSDLKVKKLSGNITMNTASGNLYAEDLEGDVVIKSPSGDIEIKHAVGGFDVKSASGDVRALDLLLTKESIFKTASGDIYVSTAKSLTHNLSLITASGNAVLNYNSNEIEGYFEFRASVGSGKIRAPYPFEKEEEIEKWGRKYSVKAFKRVFNKPRVEIFTASGEAVLKKD